MSDGVSPTLVWVLLTMGDRPAALWAALDSVADAPRHVVINGAAGGGADLPGDVGGTILDDNVGVPAGRDVGIAATAQNIVAFLDDDAVAPTAATEQIIEAFAADDRLGAVSLRLVDEDGRTTRRHVPRPGGKDPERSGEVALFLGGACAIRREAYEDVGGYFTELFYGHEELELSWRLVDRGWRIRYLADVEVFHPRSEISRHATGWELTGRNRVWIARRTLPWPVAIVHVVTWLLLGLVRAPGADSRRAYLRGWMSGWRKAPIERRPISWRGIWRLTKLGRPPIF